MGKFREKLLDFKRRLSDRRMYSIVLVAIALLGGWGVYQARERALLRQELDNQYNRAFYEMIDYVQNVEVLLLKSMISSSPEAAATTMQRAWEQANLAQTNLGQLPISQPILASTSKFLSQVGDMAFALNKQNMNGKALDEEQYKTIEQLHGYATALEQNLDYLQATLATGRLRWGELAKKGTPLFSKTSEELQNDQFSDMDKTFQDYPTLIYDGPFSDHMSDVKPKALSGEEITAEQAQQKVVEFFGKDRVTDVQYMSKNDLEPFKTYSFQVTVNGGQKGQMAMIDITQKGGHVLWMLYNKPMGQAAIDVEKAKEVSKKFLETLGFENMQDTYYMKEDGSATINYAYKQDDVVVYPDLVKVKVALDTGEIIGFESKGYLTSHHQRQLPKVGVSLEEAQGNINKRLSIGSSGYAVIPTDYNSEVFVYEFKGKLNDKDFLIYINAQTGKEEQTLMIIDTPSGILTM